MTPFHAMLEERFDADGFAVIPQILSAQECDTIAALTGGLAEDGAGTRCLLPQAWCGVLSRRRAGPLVSCAMDRGGVLAMRPLALHASSKASGNSRRRVLHFVFGPPTLPHGLDWLHAA